MTKHLLDDLHVHAAGEGEGRSPMTQVVQPDRRETRGLDQAAKVARDEVRMQRLGVGLNTAVTEAESILTKALHSARRSR